MTKGIGALLHKSVFETTSPFPGRTYPMGSVTFRSKSRAMSPWPRSLTQFIFVSARLLR